jgi:hypothetical protein
VPPPRSRRRARSTFRPTIPSSRGQKRPREPAACATARSRRGALRSPRLLRDLRFPEPRRHRWDLLPGHAAATRRSSSRVRRAEPLPPRGGPVTVRASGRQERCMSPRTSTGRVRQRPSTSLESGITLRSSGRQLDHALASQVHVTRGARRHAGPRRRRVAPVPGDALARGVSEIRRSAACRPCARSQHH